MRLKLTFVHLLVPLLMHISICIKPTLALAQSDPCSSASDCGQCTKISECVWCNEKSFTATPNRCLRRKDADLCKAKHHHVIDSQLKFTIHQNKPLTGTRVEKDPVQLKPQLASLTNVRVGQVTNISVQFQQAQDYPIDLYCLMDLSNSMRDDKENLENVSHELAKTMGNITRLLKIGFGSFIDKNTYPFVDNTSIQIWGKHKAVGKTYSFINHLPLNNNIDEFKKRVQNTPTMGNADEPEGGFDALLQAMVCEKEINWGNTTRRLIIFATDADSHMAGDGKIGGILKPNDGKCHLDNTGSYTEPLNQDYPSLGHISRKAQDHSVNIIFAVTQNVVETYKKFEKLIRGSKVGVLASDASNIVTLVKDQYEAIRSEVILRDNAADGVQIRYFTSCLDPFDELKETRVCGGLGVGNIVNYTVSINITKCPDENNRNQRISISPSGLSESLIIDLEIVCDCPCERADNYTCPSRCKDFEPCAICHQSFEDIPFENWPDECQMKNCSVIKEEGKNVELRVSSERKCSVLDQTSGCITYFVYGFSEDGDREQVRYARSCPPPLDITTIAFSILGALVAVGIGLLLIWRLLLFLYDRKEYARFVNNSKNAKWNTDNNPLYVEATSTFANPAFNANQRQQ